MWGEAIEGFAVPIRTYSALWISHDFWGVSSCNIKHLRDLLNKKKLGYFIVFIASKRYKLGEFQEKAMAPHSSTLAWKIPRMEDPGGLQSMGSLRVGHDWVTSISLFAFLHWRRKWQPNTVFLPGESHRQGSLVGCHLRGHTESDTTEAT